MAEMYVEIMTKSAQPGQVPDKFKIVGNATGTGATPLIDVGVDVDVTNLPAMSVAVTQVPAMSVGVGVTALPEVGVGVTALPPVSVGVTDIPPVSVIVDKIPAVDATVHLDAVRLAPITLTPGIKVKFFLFGIQWLPLLSVEVNGSANVT